MPSRRRKWEEYLTEPSSLGKVEIEVNVFSLIKDMSEKLSRSHGDERLKAWELAKVRDKARMSPSSPPSSRPRGVGRVQVSH